LSAILPCTRRSAVSHITMGSHLRCQYTDMISLIRTKGLTARIQNRPGTTTQLSVSEQILARKAPKPASTLGAAKRPYQYGQSFENILAARSSYVCAIASGAIRAAHIYPQRPADSEFFLKNSVSRKRETRYLIQKFWPIWILLGRLGDLLGHGIQAKQKGINCWKFFR